VNRSKLTMIVIDTPGTETLGSPDSEPGRDASDEAQWTCDLNWSFAISDTEISQADYHNLLPEYREYLNEHSPLPNSPANSVTWFDAIKYCRLLSEREGVPDSEMVVPPIDRLKTTKFADFRTRAGYRLPVE